MRNVLALPALVLLLLLCLPTLGMAATPSSPRTAREHLVFLQGTPQEIAVHIIRGQAEGPTVMLLGGIHGDEPGAYLAADLFVDISLKKGTLIVVPRANFASVVHHHRGTGGDMNRKFDALPSGDPEYAVVAVLKSLMAESDLLITMHDGSGFYRPTRESDIANPNRYGQCIIADADAYPHTPTGRTVQLKTMAQTVVDRLNQDIPEPLHRFHFFNMRTTAPDSGYKEHRMSATYYALTRFGIPAFCVEASKNLPSLEMKVRQHVQAVNAFLDLAGVERDMPGLPLGAPGLSHVVVTVNALPVAVADGQTLLVTPGDTLTVVHIGATHPRGLTAEINGDGGATALNRPHVARKPERITIRKDNTVLGTISVALLPEQHRGTGPRVTGPGTIRQYSSARAATLAMLPGSSLVAALEKPPAPQGATAQPKPQEAPGTVAGFVVEVDGTRHTIAPGTELAVRPGAVLHLIDITAQGGSLPAGTVMNLKGFIAEKGRNTGEDRGAAVNTATDLMPAFSERKQGDAYAINAEQGKTVLASCVIRIGQVKLESVTVRAGNRVITLKAWSRTAFPTGSAVELLSVAVSRAATLQAPRYTLGGHPLPATLPQTLTMREIAVNLAVFDGETLVGKVTLVPARTRQ